MRLVVTGTGRSGTKWAATVLRMAGYKVGHEQVFTRMGGDWSEDWYGDSSLWAVPHLGGAPDGVWKVLLMRNKEACVASWVKNGPLLAGSAPPGLTDLLEDWVLDTTDEQEAASNYYDFWHREALKHVDVAVGLDGLSPDGLLEACRVEARWPLYPLGPVNVS